ncbi:MAG: HAMP domain-containing protein [SAR324 cluster bacterium]|nr:HAMP domain-containing protein [SAR324 cluster bacterium]
MIRLSIGFKIIGLNIFIALAVAFIVTLVSIRQITQQINERLLQTGENLVQNIQERIRNDVEQTQRFAELLSDNQELHQFLKKRDTNGLQEWLNNQSEIEIYALLEVFDSQSQRLVTNRWLNKKPEEIEPYLTEPEDSSLAKAQDYLITVELKALPAGMILKTTVPIVDWETIDILGLLVVSFPMNQNWIDRVRGRSSQDLTIATKTSPHIATTIVTPKGKRMEKLPERIKGLLTHNTTPAPIKQLTLFNQSYTVLFSPIYDLRSIPQGHLIIWLKRDLIEATTQQILSVLLFVAIASVIGCVIFGAYLSQNLTRPLRNLVHTVKLIASGNLKQKIKITSDDEIGDLAAAVSSMQNDLQIGHALVHQMLKTFQLFVPSQFLKYIAHDGIENVQLGNAQQEMASVLFLDIRAFTSRTEKMTPQKVLDFLNHLFHSISAPIEQQGFIDKFIGDAIMAIFEEEMDSENRCQGAVPSLNAALGILEALHQFNESQDIPVQVGIGINTGAIIFGTMGSASRMDSTVLGNTVNVASRVESLTKQYGVHLLVTDSTQQALPVNHSFLMREVDLVRVMGKKEAVTVYEVFNQDIGGLKEKKLKIQSEYHHALQLYHARQWEDSLACLRSCQETLPEDQVIQIYIERCQTYLTSPPADDWDGVYTMQTK